MDYRKGMAASKIIELQHEDGTWGQCFHSLAQPNKKAPLTSEQALRRLKVLGFTIEDEPIQKAVDCMTACLRGKRKIDEYSEKLIDWELFTKQMLSTWVKIFEPDNPIAAGFAKQWANVIDVAFAGGTYDETACIDAFFAEFSPKQNRPKSLDFATFYQMNLLQGVLGKRQNPVCSTMFFQRIMVSTISITSLFVSPRKRLHQRKQVIIWLLWSYWQGMNAQKRSLDL